MPTALHAPVNAPATRRKQMNKDIKALIDGLAVGLGFVGVTGFAIDASKWPTLFLLISISMALPIATRLKEHDE
jgi:hypothetical protein